MPTEAYLTYITRMFSVRQIRAFSCLRTIAIQAPGVRTISNSKIGNETHKHAKKKKKSGTELTTKRTLAYNRRAETRRQSVVLFDFGWERAHGGTQIFHCCMRVHKWWQNRPVLTLELQINSSKQERRQTQNVRRTRINCVGTNLTASSMRTKIFSSAAPFWSIIYTL